ncbi:MAG: glycosyltransferase [Spirochaetota bacterium]
MQQPKKRIAYLAPEIPSLSSTFVYYEILELQKRGYEVTSFSIYYPKDILFSDDTQTLIEKANYINPIESKKVFSSFITLLSKKPGKLVKTLASCFWDTLSSFSFDSFKLFYHLCLALSIAPKILKSNCEHIHIHFADSATQIGMYAALLTGIPYSFTAHANDIFQHRHLLKRKGKRAKAVLTISHFNKGFIVNSGIDSTKVHLVRCGILQEDVATPTDANSKNPRIFKIGTLARFVEKKGIDILIQAMGILSKKGLPIELEIAGSGPLLDTYEKLINQERVFSKVIFLGALPHNYVYSWLVKLNLFALACKKDKSGNMDGLPVVLMEAMNAGVPVVSTELSGIPELIEHEKTGFLSQPDNPQDLADTIEKIYNRREDLGNIVTSAKNKVRREYSLEENVALLIRYCFERSH